MAKEKDVDIEIPVVTEEGKKVNLNAYLTKQEAGQKLGELAAKISERLSKRIEDNLAPYTKQAEEIKYLRLGVYALGRYLGLELPTAFADEKDADKEIKKILGKYASLLDKVDKIEERILELEGADKKEDEESESGSKKRGKGKAKSHDTSQIGDLKEDIGDVKREVDEIRESFEEDGEFYNLVNGLRESLEEGGDLYNTLIEAAREAGKEAAVGAVNELREAEELAERREGERRSGGKDLRGEVNRLDGFIRTFITDHFRGEDREKYLKQLDKNR